MHCTWSQKCSWVSTPHYAGMSCKTWRTLCLLGEEDCIFYSASLKVSEYLFQIGGGTFLELSDQSPLHISSRQKMEELKWQWWRQVDKVKCQCDPMFLALEEPMKMGLAWFVFSLSPLPHPSTKVMTSQLVVSWVCVTSMFASEIAATTRQSYIPLVSNPYAETGRCNTCNEEYKLIQRRKKNWWE